MYIYIYICTHGHFRHDNKNNVNNHQFTSVIINIADNIESTSTLDLRRSLVRFTHSRIVSQS